MFSIPQGVLTVTSIRGLIFRIKKAQTALLTGLGYLLHFLSGRDLNLQEPLDPQILLDHQIYVLLTALDKRS